MYESKLISVTKKHNRLLYLQLARKFIASLSHFGQMSAVDGNSPDREHPHHD